MTDRPPFPYLPSSEVQEPTRGYSYSPSDPLMKTVAVVVVVVVEVVPKMHVEVVMMLAQEAKS